MRNDSTDTTDIEERVLHYAAFTRAGESFTVLEAARALEIREARAHATILLLMNLEVLSRQRLSGGHEFRYAPTAAAQQLEKVRRLHDEAAAMARRRPTKTAASVSYDESRQSEEERGAEE